MTAAAEALAALDEVTYLVACTGRHDYLVEVVCRDSQPSDGVHVTAAVRRARADRSTESFSYLAVLKDSYRPFPGEW